MSIFTSLKVFWNFECSPKSSYCTAKGYQSYSVSTDSCSFNSTHSDPVAAVIEANAVSPAENYFNGRVLGLTKDKDGNIHDFDDFGGIQWELALCLLLSWLVVGLMLYKGIRRWVGDMSVVLLLFINYGLAAKKAKSYLGE